MITRDHSSEPHVRKVLSSVDINSIFRSLNFYFSLHSPNHSSIINEGYSLGHYIFHNPSPGVLWWKRCQLFQMLHFLLHINKTKIDDLKQQLNLYFCPLYATHLGFPMSCYILIVYVYLRLIYPIVKISYSIIHCICIHCI